MAFKQVPTDALWACAECGGVFVDLKNKAGRKVKPRDNSHVHYLNDNCPVCDVRRPEVIDVYKGDCDGENPERDGAEKRDQVVEKYRD